MSRLSMASRVMLCAGALALAACGDDDDDGNGPGDRTLAEFITEVSLNYEEPIEPPVVKYHPGRPPKVARPAFSMLRDIVEGEYVEGDPPSTSGAPEITVVENSSPLQGQAYKLKLSAGDDFSTVYVWLEDVDGYYEVTAPVAVGTAQLIVDLADDPPSTSFDLVTAVGNGGGVAGTATTTVETRDLGTADFAATVTWTGASDVDIHVIDPNGFEVSYINPVSPQDGRLDLDSNAGCAIDNVNTETISWRRNTAPEGDYTVIIEYYDDCEVEESTYNVVIRRDGRSPVNVGPNTFVGEFSANAPDTIGTYPVP